MRMLKSRYSGKELVEMRTSRSTVSSSRSGSDDFSGYSLITNDHCVNAPRAKVFLVAALSCVIAVIIVIIVIVTKIDESTNSQESDDGCVFEEMCGNGAGCPDYAVIGGTFAGAYAAWRLNNLNQSVFLYERTNRIGGKLFTRKFPNVSDVNLEMGLPWYIPKLSPLTSQLVNDLGLNIEPYYGNNQNEDVRYFTRGRWSLFRDIHKLYHLTNSESQHGSPKNILRKTLQSVVPFEIPDSPNATGHYSNEQSLQTALLSQLSLEAYKYIEDTSHQLDFQVDANAAQYVEYLNQQEKEKVKGDFDFYTITEGMMSLPVTMVEQAMSSILSYQSNHRLSKIQPRTNAVQLSFVKTVTSETGETIDTEETMETCAKVVILALPPKDLKQVQWTSLNSKYMTDQMESVSEVNSHVVYLLYNGTLLANEIQNKSLWIKTDLPLGEVTVHHGSREVTIYTLQTVHTKENIYSNFTTEATFSGITPNSSNNSTSLLNVTELPNVDNFVPILVKQPVTVIKAVFSASGYQNYWKSLLNSGSPINSFTSSIHTITDVTLEHIHVHLSKVLNMTVEEIPQPLDGFLEVVDEDSIMEPMSYLWKPGYDWNDISNSIFQPDNQQNVYVVGQAYAPSFYNLETEGDIFTVDKFFTR